MTRKGMSLLAAAVVLVLGSILPAGAQETGATILPEDFTYRGAFRLPVGGLRPDTFEYGGNALTFNPDGDPSGPADGFPGSLFITGHDRLAYGELPDGSRVAEIAVPVPIISSAGSRLNRAAYLQPLTDVAAGFFLGLDEIPRIGLQYLNRPETGPKVHIAWGQHFQPDDPPTPSHAWFNPDLAHANMQGSWFVSPEHPYSVNGYLFEIPADWANAYVGGRYLATGRYRDGGWSGMGPALFAYRPWIDENGTPAQDGSVLESIPLLLYADSNMTDRIERSLEGYQHADEWEGGAWLTTADGRSAVLLAGTKGTGGKYWYGWVHPQGPEYPCVETAFVGEFDVCRLADGTPCPSTDLQGCSGHNDYRGWWSSAFSAQFILYNPDDLAQVAMGQMEPHEPQPYARVDLEPYLLHNPDEVEREMLGTGVQQRGRIGDVAYDRVNQLLYVLELYAEGAQPVVHVWQIR
ncbi:MAG: hypothetical protein K8J31_14100 [Anaerolineae bacterium]|nr:hypothetical protein [Anaerolineae bacterium]